MKDLPRKHFAAIVADPPWHYKSYTALRAVNWQSRRDAAKHYATMSLEDLKALPVKDLAAPSGCHLFLWVTGPCLPLGFELMQAWGFKYSSVAFTWVKLKRSHNPMQLRTLPTAAGDLHTGLGLTTRKNAEFCLLGRRGNARRLAKDVREIILAPVREHSRKPDEVYQRVERYCAGPYLDLFTRQRRPGWVAWGLEADKFSGPLPEDPPTLDPLPGPLERLGGPFEQTEHKDPWEIPGFLLRKPYDGHADFAASYSHCLAAVRERVVAGGEPWVPKK